VYKWRYEYLDPDWRPPSWIYHFRLGRTVLQVLLDPENIGFAVGIALLSCVQLEFPHEEVVTLFTNENGTPLE